MIFHQIEMDIVFAGIEHDKNRRILYELLEDGGNTLFADLVGVDFGRNITAGG